MKRFSLTSRWRFLPLLLLSSLAATAETVHVYTQRDLDGTVTRLTDVTFDTGLNYTPAAAAKVDGYIFTGWTISANQAFVSRDHYGRALDVATLHVYEETTMTAHYLPASRDEDGDGLADGWELYWFGSLDPNPGDDTDGDGLTQTMEQALGTNPLLADRSDRVGVISVGGALVQYNPDRIPVLTIRSEPEGALFATTREFVKAGTVKTTSSYSPNSSKFAYWSLNGVRQADHLGRARDSLSIVMPDHDLEVVATCIDEVTDRKVAYWYGESTALDSDTDHDGLTLQMELALGTNPLMPDRSDRVGIVSAQGTTVQYNPDRIHTYVIKSDPAGKLFATQSDYARSGTVITTPTCNPDSTQFAYWTINGERQADHRGRAKDSLSYTMGDVDVELVAHCVTNATERKIAYWYGQETALDSDTDGDGLTLQMELALGTNPLIPDRFSRVGVISAAGTTRELNLQVYEKIHGMVVDNAYCLFDFGVGTNVRPIVSDVDGDGLWDVVVVTGEPLLPTSEAQGPVETNVFLNVGSSGNPEFVRLAGESQAGRMVLPGALDALNGLTYDVEPIDALSATTNRNELLVSDIDGRIWYYLSNNSNNSYVLQHKVWGGSHEGFAQGLKLAAVDWEDDGDLDCLCGTADGKLMLLRNPRVGRPTNLKALSGVDNILLNWDPNAQSRIRGYKVYRKDGEEGEYGVRGAPALPTYRDYFDSEALNSNLPTFFYKVSSLSRFYTAGNSTPIENESPATEAIPAVVGMVNFFWTDVNCRLGEKAQVMLSIENALHYNVAGVSQTVSYDPEYLTPVKVSKTGITEGIVIDEQVANGQWTITFTGAVDGGTPILPAGGGKFLTLVFDTLKAGTTRVGGANGATVSIEAGGDTEVPRYSLGDLNGDGKLDKEDLRELARMKEGEGIGRRYNANNLKAGDFNGNGKLDNADYQALRALLKEKGIL